MGQKRDREPPALEEPREGDPGLSTIWRALGQTHSAIAVLDERGTITYASPVLCSLVGRTTSDLEGSDLSAPPFDGDRAAERAYHEQALRGGEAIEREWKITTHDGRALSLLERASALHLDDGARRRVSTFVDVTRERALQADVAERQNASLRLLSRVMDTAPVMLVAMDVDGLITLADGKAFSVVGPSTETIGRSLEQMVNDPALSALMTRARQGEEARGTFSVGGESGFDAWVTPMRRRTTGEIAGTMLFAIDATERMQTERDLRSQLELVEHQRATIQALSTPLIRVSDEVVCLPLIGTLDADRAAEVTQRLLEGIGQHKAAFAVIDLTGVEVVDTTTADYLLRIVKTTRLLGAEGILCGIHPAVSQTMVHLGVELAAIRTMRTLREAIRYCVGARARRHARG